MLCWGDIYFSAIYYSFTKCPFSYDKAIPEENGKIDALLKKYRDLKAAQHEKQGLGRGAGSWHAEPLLISDVNKEDMQKDHEFCKPEKHLHKT